VKGQGVRALDVFVVGPAIIAGGSFISRHAPERRALGLILIGIGVATIAYNGNNWLKREAQLDAAEDERARAKTTAAAIERAQG
jgi:uncharacterized membrane protein YidH (DUF202 family)